jgi:hypothetical protein
LDVLIQFNRFQLGDRTSHGSGVEPNTNLMIAY